MQMPCSKTEENNTRLLNSIINYLQRDGQRPLELTLGKRKDKSKRHRRLMEKFISLVVSLFLNYFFSSYLTESDEHVETKV